MLRIGIHLLLHRGHEVALCGEVLQEAPMGVVMTLYIYNIYIYIYIQLYIMYIRIYIYYMFTVYPFEYKYILGSSK